MSGTIIDLTCDDDSGVPSAPGFSGDFNDLINVPDLTDAQQITCEFIAGAVISALNLVRTDGMRRVFPADKDADIDSQAIGIALNAGNIGATIDVLMFGKNTDPSYSIFNEGDDLFLGDDGLLTNIPPTTGYHLRVGKYIGNDTIFVDIDEKIEFC